MEEVLEEKNVPTKSKKDAFMEYVQDLSLRGLIPKTKRVCLGHLWKL